MDKSIKDKSDNRFIIRRIRRDEYEGLGQMTADVYARLPGMPGPGEQPEYYAMLADVDARAARPSIDVLVAVDRSGDLLGGVTFIREMADYNSGGNVSTYTGYAGVRLLAVAPAARRRGVGKALTFACIRRAEEIGLTGVVLHTTRAMAVAWQMYEKMGFKRCPDLDFSQGELPVFGFSLRMKPLPPDGPSGDSY